MQDVETIDNDFVILSLLFEENLSYFYSVRNNQTNELFTIELHKKQDEEFPANENNILNMLLNINNPNVFRYIGNGFGPVNLRNQPPQNRHYRIFENWGRYTLSDYIFEQCFSERHAKLIFKKILNGISAIHNLNICHRGIKPENIYLDENYNPKIASFDLCCLNANNLNQYVGTVKYCAPEILSRIPYNGINADIFSLGQLLFFLVTKKFAFEATLKDRFYLCIASCHLARFWKIIPLNGLNLSQSFKDLFIRMVAYNPNKRPTINQILNDKWMNEINNLNNEQIIALENEVRQEFNNRQAKINHLLTKIDQQEINEENQNNHK